ncbi:hypothetical protein KKB41_00120 [Patescibacteria group bacterium]|nr:hypothetical protein [Patescibacteria group bacterium]
MENLINDKLLEEFECSTEKAKKEFVKSEERFDAAKTILNLGSQTEELKKIAYENIYTASRFASTALLFLNNYRVKRTSRSHEAILKASECILKDSGKCDIETLGAINKLHQIRKRRNSVDYDELPSDISEAGLKIAIETVGWWIEKVRGLIEGKENSDNLFADAD